MKTVRDNREGEILRIIITRTMCECQITVAMSEKRAAVVHPRPKERSSAFMNAAGDNPQDLSCSAWQFSEEAIASLSVQELFPKTFR